MKVKFSFNPKVLYYNYYRATLLAYDSFELTLTIGLEGGKVVPHCLPSGGATLLAYDGVEVYTIARHGGWSLATSESMLIYTQSSKGSTARISLAFNNAIDNLLPTDVEPT
jgi:hypothetical protein